MVGGAVITTGIEYAVTSERGARPTVWTAPTILENKTGIIIDQYVPGDYVLWARITSSPEKPVLTVGQFRIT